MNIFVLIGFEPFLLDCGFATLLKGFSTFCNRLYDVTEAGGTGGTTNTGPGRAARARALELAQQLASSLQHAVPPPPRPDFTTASAILRWLQQNNNSVALVSTVQFPLFLR